MIGTPRDTRPGLPTSRGRADHKASRPRAPPRNTAQARPGQVHGPSPGQRPREAGVTEAGPCRSLFVALHPGESQSAIQDDTFQVLSSVLHSRHNCIHPNFSVENKTWTIVRLGSCGDPADHQAKAGRQWEGPSAGTTGRRPIWWSASLWSLKSIVNYCIANLGNSHSMHGTAREILSWKSRGR